jgi:hypothetical protein
MKGEVMKRKVCALLLGLVFLFTSACGYWVSEDRIVRAVEKQGYKNVQVLDKNIFFVNWKGCSRGDDAQFDVKATNALDVDVDLVVCAGWPFKGVTIRSD